MRENHEGDPEYEFRDVSCKVCDCRFRIWLFKKGYLAQRAMFDKMIFSGVACDPCADFRYSLRPHKEIIDGIIKSFKSRACSSQEAIDYIRPNLQSMFGLLNEHFHAKAILSTEVIIEMIEAGSSDMPDGGWVDLVWAKFERVTRKFSEVL